MSLFSRKKYRDAEDEDEEFDPSEVRDLKPENRKRRKEPLKPWGKKERYTVLIFLLATVLISAILTASSKGWKLPKFPQMRALPKWNLDFLKGETIVIEKTSKEK